LPAIRRLPGEPGHDPNVGYGRVCLIGPELNILCAARVAGKVPPRMCKTHHQGKCTQANPAGREPLVVRLQPHELDLLDAWMVKQDDIPETDRMRSADCRGVWKRKTEMSLRTEDEAAPS
jgi:hypothetical protein